MKCRRIKSKNNLGLYSNYVAIHAKVNDSNLQNYISSGKAWHKHHINIQSPLHKDTFYECPAGTCSSRIDHLINSGYFSNEMQN